MQLPSSNIFFSKRVLGLQRSPSMEPLMNETILPRGVGGAGWVSLHRSERPHKNGAGTAPLIVSQGFIHSGFHSHEGKPSRVDVV